MMENKTQLVRVAGIFLFVILFSLVGASSSSSATVHFTIEAVQQNHSFNLSVSNLFVKNRSVNSITWAWKNPNDETFFHNLVFLNNELVANNTNEILVMTNLKANTVYTIYIVCVDNLSNKGTSVSNSIKTLSVKTPEKKWTRQDSTDRTHISPGPSANTKQATKKNTVINLNEFSSQKTGENGIYNLFTILLFLMAILLVLVLIIKVSRR